jgi:hypothetical protein
MDPPLIFLMTLAQSLAKRSFWTWISLAREPDLLCGCVARATAQGPKTLVIAQYYTCLVSICFGPNSIYETAGQPNHWITPCLVGFPLKPGACCSDLLSPTSSLALSTKSRDRWRRFGGSALAPGTLAAVDGKATSSEHVASGPHHRPQVAGTAAHAACMKTWNLIGLVIPWSCAAS